MKYERGQVLSTYGSDCLIEVVKDAAAAAVTLNAVTPDGFVAGTASTPNVDLMGHKVLPGAFDESIRLKGLTGPKGIRLLHGHNRDRVAGSIKELRTVNENLRIAAQLNLGVSYVKDMYEIIKDTGGLSFSVGFRLQDFKFAEDPVTKDDILVIEKGDLMEVSIVAFAAQPEATMDFVKSADTPSEFEKALIANGWAGSRRDAHQLMQLCKNSAHLLTPASMKTQGEAAARPMLDAHQLKAAGDLTAKIRALLGGA